jgi:hypothetical protein
MVAWVALSNSVLVKNTQFFTVHSLRQIIDRYIFSSEL